MLDKTCLRDVRMTALDAIVASADLREGFFGVLCRIQLSTYLAVLRDRRRMCHSEDHELEWHQTGAVPVCSTAKPWSSHSVIGYEVDSRIGLITELTGPHRLTSVLKPHTRSMDATDALRSGNDRRGRWHKGRSKKPGNVILIIGAGPKKAVFRFVAPVPQITLEQVKWAIPSPPSGAGASIDLALSPSPTALSPEHGPIADSQSSTPPTMGDVVVAVAKGDQSLRPAGPLVSVLHLVAPASVPNACNFPVAKAYTLRVAFCAALRTPWTAERESFHESVVGNDAVGEVLSGRVKLRLEFSVVRWPNHYSDEGGAEVWNIVQTFLRHRNSAIAPHLEASVDLPGTEPGRLRQHC
jgi:hypothetical protein